MTKMTMTFVRGASEIIFEEERKLKIKRQISMKFLSVSTNIK